MNRTSEPNLARDSFFLCRAAADSLWRVANHQSVYHGDHLGGDLGDPGLFALRLAAESPARAGDPRRQRFIYILQGENVRGSILLVGCLGFVGMVDNIKPLLMGNPLGLPVLLLFFGILGGISLFGAVGIIIGPALFALLRALLDLYSQEYANADE